VLLIGVILPVLQQATGINIVMYYAPNILTSVGLDESNALLQAIAIPIVMIGFTGIALALADRVGRKPLLLVSVTGMTVSLGLLGLIYSGDQTGSTWVLLGLILLYVASFSVGMGPLVWTVIAEIFPNVMRGRAVGICILILWLANFFVSRHFPALLEQFAAKTFWFYGLFGLVAMVFIPLAVRETRGRSLESIAQE